MYTNDKNSINRKGRCPICDKHDTRLVLVNTRGQEEYVCKPCNGIIWAAIKGKLDWEYGYDDEDTFTLSDLPE